MREGVVLACDFGATGSRAALVDGDGRRLCRYAAAGVADTASPDGVEIDPDAWWRALCEAVEELAGDPVFARVAAIAVTGVTRTQILLGADGRPLRPAMTWRDSRAADMTATIAAELPRDHPEAGVVNAFHPVARLLWLRSRERRAFEAIAAILEPKDYLNFRLTGRIATDPISSARLLAAAASSPGGVSLLEAIGLRRAVVPKSLNPTAIVGQVAAGLPGALERV